jgi:23S rRNA pseudouridine2605 synthase/23S rRNA pseudouridine2604 synthase
MRLHVFLAHAGVCSRRQAEKLIAAGRVSVNGATVTAPGASLAPDSDRVSVDGQPVRPNQVTVYIALHKPTGVVTSCRHYDAPTVLSLVDVPWRVFPVGRLDKNSTGLVLLTNDGRLHQRLAHPSFDHEKEYEVGTVRPVNHALLQAMAAGVMLDGKPTRPARVARLGASRFRIVLQEGRNRQIRRMVELLGNRVKTLKRIRLATLRLGNLPEGAWRHLTAAETEALLAAAGFSAIPVPSSRPPVVS